MTKIAIYKKFGKQLYVSFTSFSTSNNNIMLVTSFKVAFSADDVVPQQDPKSQRTSHISEQHLSKL